MSATTESAWIHALIEGSYPGRHATKRVARDADVPVGTARGWLAGRFIPSTASLLRMAQQNDNLRAELIRRLEGNMHEVIGQGVLPLDGRPLHAPRRVVDRPRDVVAQAGGVRR